MYETVDNKEWTLDKNFKCDITGKASQHLERSVRLDVLFKLPDESH